MSTVDTYLDLITSQHDDKPVYVETVRASIEPIAFVYDLIASLPEKFDLDVAIGKQLDIVGEWVGRTRRVRVPLTGVYFTWDDTVQTGWDAGLWQGPFDPTSGLTLLPDEPYRLLLRAKIEANSWDGSIPDAYRIWEILFPNNIIFIQDNQDMSFAVGIAGAVLDPLTQSLLIEGYVPLKPEGIRVNYFAISIVDGPLFGWDIDNEAISGWEQASWALELIPST